ncbi:VWA domain-containing protein [Alcaligenaceae bacterium]|nr:VWA domain-containing protein [Alcaligenaceae bacterium]
MRILPALLIAVAASALPLSATHAADDVMIIYDASGSMWGQVDGVNKITTAREVMADLVKSWPEDTNLGLIAYGHRSAGSCSDIETMITPQKVDRNEFIKTVNAIVPKGKTPISDSLKQAADVLQYRDNNATIVLISDGLESCHGDPCAVAAELQKNGVDFTAHVVGFDLDQKGNEALSCIAKNTGGIFVPASNANELKDALRQVQAQVTQEQAKPEPAPEPVAEPKPEEPEYDVEITAPEQAITGSSFPVSWSSVVNQYDKVTIVAAGAKEGTYGDRFDVGKKQEGHLTAPAQPGMYEVRYTLNAGGKTIASTPVEVVEAEQGVSAPEQVIAGSSFPVSWTSIVNRYDKVTIVPAGAKEGTYGDRFDVEKKLEGQLTAPAQPGMYEVRYTLNTGGKTLASTPVEVTEAELGISAPEQVMAGSSFPVSWSSVVNRYDKVTIIPAGAKEGTYGDRFDVGKKQEGHLTAPAQPGMYEVRYTLNAGGKTLASTPVEVTEAKVTIEATDVVRANTPIEIRWSAVINRYDKVTIVPAGAKEGTRHNRFDVGQRLEGTLKAPAEPGLYEVRYTLNAGGKTVASAPVEVVAETAALDSGAGLQAPANAKPGASITVSWSGGSDSKDQRIVLAKADAADFTWIAAHKVGDDKSQQLTLPDEPGRYEVRYLDVSNTTVLGRAIVEVK